MIKNKSKELRKYCKDIKKLSNDKSKLKLEVLIYVFNILYLIYII